MKKQQHIFECIVVTKMIYRQPPSSHLYIIYIFHDKQTVRACLRLYDNTFQVEVLV